MVPKLSLSSSSTRFSSDPIATARRRLQNILRTTQDPNARLTTAPNSKSLTPWMAPASIVGGTVVCYSTILQHSTISPLAFVYMILLAIQYAVQPRLSKRYIHSDIPKDTVALVEESVKSVLAGIIYCAVTSSKEVSSSTPFDWKSSLIIAGIPATLYALQGVLQYMAYQNIDSVTFNGIAQTKTFTAAFFCYVLLGIRQSTMQMVALFLLVVSTLLFQHQALVLGSKNAATTTNAVSSLQLKQRQRSTAWASGVLPCLGATVLSGLAGALSQKGLQLNTHVMRSRDAFFFTTEVSVYSALVLLLSMLRRALCRKRTTDIVNTITTHSTNRWTYQTWIPIVTKATGGILTALVHQTAGSVQKGFALVLGLVLIGYCTDRRPTAWQNLATLLVLFSAYLHFTNPPM